MCRGCGCRGSIGWMGALFDTTRMFRRRLVESKKSDVGPASGPIPAGNTKGRAPCRAPPLCERPAEACRLLLFATATLEVPHLVEPAFLLGRLSGHPLPLLDELADLLPALVADLRVELGAARRTDRLATLLADLLVELVPALRLDRLTAFAADLLVECACALLGDF